VVQFSAGKKQNLRGLKNLLIKLNTTLESVLEENVLFRKMDRITEKVSLICMFYHPISVLIAFSQQIQTWKTIKKCFLCNCPQTFRNV